MNKWRKRLGAALNGVAGLSLIVMVALTVWQVVNRYLFHEPSAWSEELMGYLVGWTAMFGATICIGERSYMNIPIAVDRLWPSVRRILLVFREVVALLFSAVILVCGGVAMPKLALGQQTASLEIAEELFYWVMPVCGVLMVVYSVMNITDIVRGKGKYGR